MKTPSIPELHVCETGTEYFVSFRSYGEQLIFGSSALCIQMRELMHYYKSDRTVVDGCVHESPRVHIRAYCIMPDEYALVLTQTADCGIEVFCSAINEAIGAYYGALFKDLRRVFKDDPIVTPILTSQECLSAIRYVNLMPIQGDMIRDGNLHSYPWCSLSEIMSCSRNSLVDAEMIREFFPNTRAFMMFIQSGKV